MQNDGASTNYFGKNLVNTVADGIYHMGFEIQGDRFLNEDGNANATPADVASWLNVFYNQAVLVNGDGNANTIAGSDDREQINAGGGNDVVNAGGGNDLVHGSWGNDTIDGGAGDDIVYGGSGNDAVVGGAGNDVFRVLGNKASGFEGYDTYAGGDGDDTVAATGGAVDIGMTQFSAADGIERSTLPAPAGRCASPATGTPTTWTSAARRSKATSSSTAAAVTTPSPAVPATT